jgi:hypothetical protein
VKDVTVIPDFWNQFDAWVTGQLPLEIGIGIDFDPDPDPDPEKSKSQR